MLLSLLIALLLLGATRFGFVRAISGLKPATSALALSEGDYVSAEISMDLGIYGEEFSSGTDDVTGRYVIVPMGEQFVSVLLPTRYFHSEEAVRAATYDWINGHVEVLSSYMLVTGTVRSLTSAEQAVMYDWFELNNGWMTQVGLIGPVDDFANYLSDNIICVDEINGIDTTAVYICSIIAGLLALFALVAGIVTAVSVSRQNLRCSEALRWIDEHLDDEDEADEQAPVREELPRQGVDEENEPPSETEEEIPAETENSPEDENV